LGYNDFKATDGCLYGNEGWGYNSRHTVRRAVLMLQVLNDGNPHSCQTYFRNFAQMISTMPMKQVYFIVPRQMVP
jgi:alanyl-tRNA synthetase